jgi:type II restriction enzyme
MTTKFECTATIPRGFTEIEDTPSEVDVVWVERDARRLRALFEVEHSTPVYSGLLRFNDVHLTNPSAATTYSIVSNDDRRSLFVRQLKRPTFKASRLAESCTFLEYPNVFTWYQRMSKFEGR